MAEQCTWTAVTMRLSRVTCDGAGCMSACPAVLEWPVPRLIFNCRLCRGNVQQVLTAEQGRILQDERRLLADLQVALTRLDAPDADLVLIPQRPGPAGRAVPDGGRGRVPTPAKSAVINALLGGDYLPEGVVPTTSELVLIRHSEAAEQPGAELAWRCAAARPWLQEVNLVDTPGTNAVIRLHQELTEHFVPRSDLRPLRHQRRPAVQ